MCSQGPSRGLFFADLFGHAMTVGEHVAETETHRPAEQLGHEWAAGQFIGNAVSQPCFGPGGLEFMSVDPIRERTVDLFVHKQPVPLVGRVERDPLEDSNAEFHAGAFLDAARPADQAHRRKRRCQQSEGIFPLVETKHGVYRRIDEDTLHKRGHKATSHGLPDRP